MSRRNILVVENNPDDLFFLKRALRNARVTDNLHSVSEGRSAIAYLSGQNEYADRNRFPLPWLIFLDLKLPYKSGIEVLEFIRNQPRLQGINVVVVTSSEDDKDMRRTTELGVNAYLMKPPSAYVLERLFASPQLVPPREEDGAGSLQESGATATAISATMNATAVSSIATSARTRVKQGSRNPWRYLYETQSKELVLLGVAAIIGLAAVVLMIIAMTK